VMTQPYFTIIERQKEPDDAGTAAE